MKIPLSDIEFELTEMIDKFQILLTEGFVGRQANAEYVKRMRRIEILKEIREHYRSLSNLQELLKEPNLICRDIEGNLWPKF